MIENLAAAVGIRNIHIVNPMEDVPGFEKLVRESLAKDELTLIIVRRPCLLVEKKIETYEKAAQAKKAGGCNG